jgi:hypothetical protein
MIPLAGFAPDADATTPGIFTDCLNIVPTESGFAGALSPIAVAVAVLPGECRGAAVANKLDATRRVMAGTQTKLYELNSTTWLDRSKTGGYVGSSESRWSFCQFGDTTLATNLADPMQESVTGVFIDVPTAPKAKIVVSASNNFVLAFGTNDPTYGPSPDRWWNCAQSNQNDWVPNVTTLANTGRLVAIGGPITAARTLGDYVVAYKSKGVFLGTFVGSPVVWQWNLIPGADAGAVGMDAVCDIGTAHFMVGDDDFWVFDGTRPVPVGEGSVRKFFTRSCSSTYRYKTKCSYDRQLNLVYIDYPSVSSTGACDSRLVFHIGTKRWGRAQADSQAPLNFVSPGVTIDGLDVFAATIDGLPNVPFDSPYWLAGGRMAAYFNSANQLVTNGGVTGDSYFISGDLGDDDTVSMLDNARVRFSKRPLTARATGFFKFNEGDDLQQGVMSNMNDGKFDLRQSGRFHRVRIDMTGSHAETAMTAKPKPVGMR